MRGGPRERGSVWNARRRWLGNLIPSLVGLPMILGAMAWWWRDPKQWAGPILVALAGTAATWLAMSRWGLYQNAAMKRELKGSGGADREWFVGAATPSHNGMVDPHEDVGWLRLTDKTLEFKGDSLRFSIDKSSVTDLRLAPNIHSLVGLGGWIRVAGKGFRVDFELRDKPTLWQNARLRKALFDQLKTWRG